MLTLEAVGYRYAGAQQLSLQEVSLDLRDGEVVGLVGASESGKTTLCLVASGLAPRTVRGRLYGRVLLDGVDAAPLGMDQIAARIGIAFASPATQLSGVSGTVYEEVAFGPMNLGLPLADVIERTDGALAALRIEALADRDPFRLSGGQQQLVAIAGLHAMRPAHLVLDEPTAQLDPAGTAMVAEALARLAHDGASILVAEHKTDILAGICSRVVALEAGRVVIDGPATEVLSDPRLQELGVAPPAIVRLERAAREGRLPAPALARLAKALAQ
ncbi:MAG: energy-coupling factor ABC transporter ATP-binding protein [Chloroflexota bacterium]|nr:energy-coupling factor ABC transporter ATP-binding protein [Chloroflexota bacterium]